MKINEYDIKGTINLINQSLVDNYAENNPTLIGLTLMNEMLILGLSGIESEIGELTESINNLSKKIK